MINDHQGDLFSITHEVDGFVDFGIVMKIEINKDVISIDGFSLISHQYATYKAPTSGGHITLRLYYPGYTTRKA